MGQTCGCLPIRCLSTIQDLIQISSKPYYLKRQASSKEVMSHTLYNSSMVQAQTFLATNTWKMEEHMRTKLKHQILSAKRSRLIKAK